MNFIFRRKNYKHNFQKYDKNMKTERKTEISQNLWNLMWFYESSNEKDWKINKLIENSGQIQISRSSKTGPKTSPNDENEGYFSKFSQLTLQS